MLLGMTWLEIGEGTSLPSNWVWGLLAAAGMRALALVQTGGELPRVVAARCITELTDQGSGEVEDSATTKNTC